MRSEKLTPQKRVLLTEELYEEVKRIQNKTWKPFWKSFSSFRELDVWKRKQRDPRLW